MLRRFLLLPFAVSAAFAWPLACGSSDPLQLCGEIPENGCPIGRGGTCDDPTCAALYDCVSGKWTVVTTCGPGHDGGGGTGPDGGPKDAGPDVCTPVMFDHSGEKQGCMPDLENPPDCPAAAAEGCAESSCLTGCSDFFLCTADGWLDVAFCDDNGDLVITQK